MILPVLFVIIIIAADQTVKYIVRLNIKPGELIILIDRLIGVTHVENRGAAFGMLQNMRWLFIALTVFAVVVIAHIIFTKKVKGIGTAALTMILGGAIGNFIDRVFHGYVTDMFEFQFINFAIFNVADIFVTVGGVLICLYVLFCHSKQSGGEKFEN